MNTVGSLESQHREVEKLFFRIANASHPETRTRLLEELADHLSAYAAIEGQTATTRGFSMVTANAAPPPLTRTSGRHGAATTTRG